MIDEVDRETLHPPVLVRAQQLAHAARCRRRRRSAARTIGRSPEMPAATGPTADRRRAGCASDGAPEAAIGVDQRRGEPLEVGGLARPRRRGGAAAPAPASTRASSRGRTRCGRDGGRSGPSAPPRVARDDRPERDARDLAGRDSSTRQRSAKTGSSTVPTVFDSGRPSLIAMRGRQRAAAAEEARAVGLVLRRPERRRLRRPRSARPRSRLRRRARRDASRQRVELRRGARSARTSSRRPDARCRSRAWSAPARRTTSARSRACAGRC